jgi:hypothetical protein
MYTYLLHHKLYTFYNSTLVEEQNVFIKGKSCADGYFVLKLLRENNREYNIESHLAFVDIRKAFDTVDRIKLMGIIKNDGVSNQLIKTMFNTRIYRDNYFAVGGEDKQSEWRLINQGVRQGCSLSTLLFIIYVHKFAVKRVETDKP